MSTEFWIIMKEKSIQQQVQFWGAIGPLMTIFTLLVCMMKHSVLQYGFPISLLLAIPLCWKWKFRGLALSLGLLLSIIAYHFFGMAMEERLWFVGLSLAAISSLVITTLSFDEVTLLIDSVQIESKSRLDNLLQLDENLRELSISNQEKIEKLIQELKKKECESAESKIRAENSDRLSQIVREELATVHAKYEEIQQEFFDLRHKYSQSQIKIENLNHDLASQVALEINNDKENELLLSLEEVSKLKVLLEVALKEKEVLLKKIEKKAASPKKDSGEMKELQRHHKKLQQQFDEKSKLLEDARRALFHMQEKLVSTQREINELKKNENLSFV